MLPGPVLSAVQHLKHVKSAVGSDVRPLEIFDYATGDNGGGGPVLDPFDEDGWDVFDNDGAWDVSLFGRGAEPATILTGDVIEYELNGDGTWIDSGITWYTPSFLIFTPIPDRTPMRIRYVQAGYPSPPSDSKILRI